ncbi:IS3 family transposase [Paenibacillus validus]|uniref:IS3 family transposase n=1 Tax=Paenibacillus validus TaxID=44253 RepID=A0A7X2ZBL9_9BACL|nr:IS3 family transposase [Paenibacillus validus]
MKRIEAVHSIRPSFGYRRVTDRLRKDGCWTSKQRVLKAMQRLGIQARLRKKQNYRIGTEHHSVGNVLNRNFTATRPMEKIVTDVTYLYSRGTVQYLSVFLDLYNNEILELEVSDRNDLELVIRPLQRLLSTKKSDLAPDAIIHSDQGNQYTSIAYGRLLEQRGITQCMSRKGTPLDNAPVESFFGWFKNELYVDYRPRSPEELREAVYVHALFHNNERPQTHPFPTGMSALSGFNISVYKDLTSSALAAFLHPF